jgi:DNA polymerase-3 subunit gamma/tau
VAAAVGAHLRDALLSLMAPDLVSLPDTAMERVADQARRLGPAALVRALDAIGAAILLLPNAPDPRVTLEVALVKVTRPDVDASPAALLERIERLERDRRQVTTAIVDATSPLGPGTPLGEDDDAGTPAAAERCAPARAAAAREALAGDRRREPACAPVAAKAALGAVRGAPRSGGAGSPGPEGGRRALGRHGAPPADAADTPAAPATRAASSAVATAGGAPPSGAGTGARASASVATAGGAAPAGAAAAPDRGTTEAHPPGGGPPVGQEAHAALPTMGELVDAWGERVVPLLTSVSRGRFSTGRFVDVADGAAVLALPNEIMRGKCEERRPELERVLAEHFGRPVPVRLVVDPAVAPTAAAPGGRPLPEPDDHVDLDGLVDAPDDHRTGIDRLTQAFPGAEVVEGA